MKAALALVSLQGSLGLISNHSIPSEPKSDPGRRCSLGMAIADHVGRHHHPPSAGSRVCPYNKFLQLDITPFRCVRQLLLYITTVALHSAQWIQTFRQFGFLGRIWLLRPNVKTGTQVFSKTSCAGADHLYGVGNIESLIFAGRAQKGPWVPSFATAFRAFLLMRVAGAMYSNIQDCDEGVTMSSLRTVLCV